MQTMIVMVDGSICRVQDDLEKRKRKTRTHSRFRFKDSFPTYKVRDEKGIRKIQSHEKLKIFVFSNQKRKQPWASSCYTRTTALSLTTIIMQIQPNQQLSLERPLFAVKTKPCRHCIYLLSTGVVLRLARDCVQ